MIRGSYICRDKGGCLYTVRRVFFRCLVYRDDNFTENPTEVAVALCFNGPVLCHRGKVCFFFPKSLSYVAAGRVPTCPGFFYSPQCHAGVSWRAADSQSSVQLVLRVGGGKGERTRL